MARRQGPRTPLAAQLSDAELTSAGAALLPDSHLRGDRPFEEPDEARDNENQTKAGDYEHDGMATNEPVDMGEKDASQESRSRSASAATRGWTSTLHQQTRTLKKLSELGPALWKSLLEMPTRLGELAQALEALGTQPLEEKDRQRDLLPLPFYLFDNNEVPYPPGVEPEEARRHREAWTRLIVTSLNYEYANRAAVPRPLPARGRMSKAQRTALKKITQQVDLLLTTEPADLEQRDWQEELKKKKVSYEGCEVSLPQKLTLAQIKPGLPPKGVAASIPAERLASGIVRECLLDPSLVMRPRGERAAAPYRAQVWADDADWEEIVAYLYEIGIVGFIPEGDIAVVDGELILNGGFGVEKLGDDPIDLAGVLLAVLRLIINLIPANASQIQIQGDIDDLPATGQLTAVAVCEDETLLWSGADRKCFFYCFTLPAVWWPWMALSRSVRGATLGRPELRRARAAVRVVGMGWLSAVGVTQHLHKNLLKHESQLPRELPAAREVTRRRPFPMGTTREQRHAWAIYIDNLEIMEVVDRNEAEQLKGSISPLLEAAKENYDVAGSAGNDKKEVRRVTQVVTLGERIDGEQGWRSPPSGYGTRLALMTCWLMARGRVPRVWAQVLLGRWVRVQGFRRPTAVAFASTWPWLAKMRGNCLPRDVVIDLVIAISLLPLYRGDLRMEIDPLVTVSDASEKAGAVCASRGLSEKGLAFSGEPSRVRHQPAEEELVVLSAFDGIGGLRRSLDLIGIRPALFLSSEIDKDAVRVVLRRWPDTVDLGSIEDVTVERLRLLLHTRPRLKVGLVAGGFPCQGMSRLNVDRRGLSDPRSGLAFVLLELVRLVKEAFPEIYWYELLENVESGPSDDVELVSEEVGCTPYFIEAGDFVHVRRPRLYWASWDVIRVPYVSMAWRAPERQAPGTTRQWGRTKVQVSVDLGSPDRWLDAGATFDGNPAVRRLPTFVRWEARKRPPKSPAGLHSCRPHEIARWQAARFATPVYQFKDSNCLKRADGTLEPPSAAEREKLMGFEPGHTVPLMSSSKAKNDPAQFELGRRAVLGNSFQCDVVAWLLAHLFVKLGWLACVPRPEDIREPESLWRRAQRLAAFEPEEIARRRLSAEELDNMPADSVYVGRGCPRLSAPPSVWGNPVRIADHTSRDEAVEGFYVHLCQQPELVEKLGELCGQLLVCHCRPDQRCHAEVLAWLCGGVQQAQPWRLLTPEQRVVYEHLRAVDLNGSDVRLDAGEIMSSKCWPRKELDVDLWHWGVVVQHPWQQEQHINVLEARSGLSMLRWRTRATGRLNKIFLHLLDSQVCIAVLTKHRSSSKQLMAVLRPFCALELASHCRALFGFTSSGRNPADDPSRWRQRPS